MPQVRPAVGLTWDHASNRDMATIYTVGHSTRSLDELVATLQAHGITTLVDIRAFPGRAASPTSIANRSSKSCPGTASLMSG